MTMRDFRLCLAFRWILTSRNKPTNYLRPLGITEEYKINTALCGVGQLSNVVFISSKEQLNESNIRQCLTVLSQNHILLRSHVVKNNGKMYWKEMEKPFVDFRINITTHWNNVFSNDLSEKFDVNRGPLWRVTYLPNVQSKFADTTLFHHSAFIIGFHHAIIDGQGRLYLLQELRELLNNLHVNGAHKHQNSKQVLGNEKVPVALDHYVIPELTLCDRICLFITQFQLTKRLILHFKLRQNSDQTSLDKCIRFISNSTSREEPKTSIYPFVINELDTNTIIRACKSMDVSVGAAIQAAGVISNCKMIQETALKQAVCKHQLPNGQMTVAAAVSRDHLWRGPDESTSYVVCGAWPIENIPIDISRDGCADKFWELANRYMRHVQKERDRSKRKAHVKFGATKDTITKFIEGIETGRRVTLLQFHNAGSASFLNNKSDSDIKFTAQFVAVGEHVIGPVFANTICTFDDKIFWGVAFYPDVTTKEMAECYLHRTVAILLEECNKVLNENKT